MPALLRIDLDSAEPAWRQIVEQIRAALVAGEVKPGEQLATVRELALDLGVNHNTVAEAYRQLAAEGFLRLGRGVGAVVVERAPQRATREEQQRFARRLRVLVAEARAAGVPAAVVGAALRRAAGEVPA